MFELLNVVIIHSSLVCLFLCCSSSYCFDVVNVASCFVLIIFFFLLPPLFIPLLFFFSSNPSFVVSSVHNSKVVTWCLSTLQKTREHHYTLSLSLIHVLIPHIHAPLSTPFSIHRFLIVFLNQVSCDHLKST